MGGCGLDHSPYGIFPYPFYELGNQARELRGYPKKTLKDFVRSRSVVEFLISLERRYPNTPPMAFSHTPLELDSSGRVLNMKKLKPEILSY